MAALRYDISYTEPRNRLTNAFRFILAIPHLFIAGIWSYLAQALGVVQWFIVLFTGRRNQSMWDLQYQWLGYNGRAIAYGYMMFDEPYPPFGTDRGNVPVVTELEYEEPADRLTNGLRLLWMIPALIIAFGIGIALFVVAVITWFAILFTGRHPRGMFDFMLGALRYTQRLSAYGLLMTDTYPKFETGADPVAASGRPAAAWNPPGQPLPPPA